jgi:hypothetical protein
MVEKKASEMHKEQEQSIKERISFMPMGDYSEDYAKGILRGITVVIRVIYYLKMRQTIKQRREGK